MVAKLIPVIFLIVGLGAGIGAGLAFAPAKKPETAVAEEKAVKEDKATGKKTGKSKEKGEAKSFEYLKMTKQFVVPVVKDDQIEAMVTLSLSLEANPAITETYYAIEPKLRDGFLQVLFDQANTGGFDGAFTESGNLDVLRKSLLEVARKEFGDDVSKVLILSVNRQDS
ncbi:flagellar basal body-associated protein FliL [Ruegeria sp. YS9]|uniref:flagellar basal body-associated protein FliL n=1 Tax=Ruegeria sp. YS9 TaxID=2966453 RepID=UPI00214C444C|nr:flagellar basal body-associated protein FliL [Ruegeria sp. YS9]UUV06131.1 flagellar basal body-associated protein FliL [Ruegeria sp. YS9]